MKKNDTILMDKLIGSSNVKISGGIHTFVNPYSYMLLRSEVEICSYFSTINIDGISLVKLINMIARTNLKRISFDMTSLAPIVFKDVILSKSKIVFVGSKKEEIQSFIRILKSEYPDMDVCFYRDGYFENAAERESTLHRIVELDPKYVIVGMGAKIQERFLIDLKSKGWGGVGFTCGGFIHQTSKGINYYPKFVNNYNLRWAYRMYDEPKLIRRYVIDYPISLIKIIKDCFDYRK